MDLEERIQIVESSVWLIVLPRYPGMDGPLATWVSKARQYVSMLESSRARELKYLENGYRYRTLMPICSFYCSDSITRRPRRNPTIEVPVR